MTTRSEDSSTIVMQIPKVLFVLFGTALLEVVSQRNPCSTPFWECRSGVAHFKGSPALSIFGFPQAILVEFDNTINEVKIRVTDYKVSIEEIKGASIKKIDVECPKELVIDQLCQSLIQPNPNIVAVEIVNTNLTFNQFQDCSQMVQSESPKLVFKRSTIYMEPKSLDKSRYMSFKLGSRKSSLYMTTTRIFDVAGIEFKNYYDNVFLTDVIMEDRASYTCIQAQFEEGKVCVPVNMGFGDDPTILHYPDQPVSESTTESSIPVSKATHAENVQMGIGFLIMCFARLHLC